MYSFVLYYNIEKSDFNAVSAYLLFVTKIYKFFHLYKEFKLQSQMNFFLKLIPSLAKICCCMHFRRYYIKSQ